MVTTPDEHPWSSFAANACGEASDLVEPHPVYRALGAAPDQRRGAYRELFRHEIPEVDLCAIRDATQCGWALGGLVMPYRKWLVLAAGLVLALSAAAIAYVMQAR